MNHSKLAGRMVALGLVTAVVVACGPEMGGMGGGAASVLGNAACPELQGGAMGANFVADAKANGTIRAFVTASGDLASLATKVEGEVYAACQQMAKDLGVPPEQLAPQPNQSKTAAACAAVSAKIDAILAAGASASVKTSVTPPRCEVKAEVEAACKGQCNATIDPGYVKAHCEPGHLYGQCEGTCAGTCAGTCTGECQGECAGQAKAAGGKGAASGKCAGECKGTCKGTCSADCHGTCTVDFKEPKCDVALKGPSADVHCEGSCKAHADLTAQCTEAKVEISSKVDVGEMPKLIATLRANLPALVKAELAYGQRLAGDIEILVRAGAELPSAMGNVGAHAAACVAAAANATVSAQASFRVSVQASASISAKAGAHGGT